ncbi:50S ribosomal protein L18 [Candidatus Nanohalovita haloferacivicina]|uniref:50S ribosomal protein L18 n=1 Tax=Candidatus Nanohalovita haloferacivicina TaxID=2978046 RepID=UPI00325FAB9D|nr:Ribosomal protein L18 [Candidatus Nanohalobia archaeon BNXNv]
MAETSNYKVPFRRRREQKTDYEQRLKLVKSGKPRAVVRTSNQHTRAHLAHYNKDGDENEAQTLSKELKEYGWEHNTGNLPAAYLTGYLAAKKADSEEAILDIGLREQKTGGRIFAAVKGMRDAGLEVPAGEKVFPEEGRIRGEHIEEMKEDSNITENFEEVKENIEGDY